MGGKEGQIILKIHLKDSFSSLQNIGRSEGGKDWP